MRKQFSLGNRKLSKNIIIWNLPIGATCPGAGACKEWCYETKIERMYKNTRPFRQNNLRLSQRKDFVQKVVSFLTTRNEEFVRIHEAGDFYSQAYLDKWKNISSLVPDKYFYCYTKSLHLDLWKGTPSNMKIFQSTGGKYDQLIDWSKSTFRAAKKGDPTPTVRETTCLGGGCGDACTLCMDQSPTHITTEIHK